MFKKIRNKKGFTLIELLIVVAIIAILAAIAIPQFSAYRMRGYNASAQSDLRNIGVVQEAMAQDYQSYGVTESNTVPGSGTTALGGNGQVILGPSGGASRTVRGALLTTNDLTEANIPQGLPIGVGSGVGVLANASLTTPVTIGANTNVVTANSYTMITKHTLASMAFGKDSDTTALFQCTNNDPNAFIGIALQTGGSPSVLPPPTNGSNDFATNPACNGDTQNPNWVAK